LRHGRGRPVLKTLQTGELNRASKSEMGR